jgi:hypothetical protein
MYSLHHVIIIFIYEYDITANENHCQYKMKMIFNIIDIDSHYYIDLKLET